MNDQYSKDMAETLECLRKKYPFETLINKIAIDLNIDSVFIDKNLNIECDMFPVSTDIMDYIMEIEEDYIHRFSMYMKDLINTMMCNSEGQSKCITIKYYVDVDGEYLFGAKTVTNFDGDGNWIEGKAIQPYKPPALTVIK